MGDFRIANLSNRASLTEAQSDRALQELRNQRPHPAAKDTSTRINKAAHDFESILVGQWLEKAEKSFATVPGTDPDQSRDSGHDQFQSIACQFMSQGITNSGGFGIAKMISQRLTAATNQAAEHAQKETSESALAVTLNTVNSKIIK
jgi:Rod binding domain-containing protein